MWPWRNAPRFKDCLRDVSKFLLLLIASLVMTFGQDSQQGSIAGFVYDSTQAVIPGAQISVTNRSTGLTRKATVNESGTYSVLGLQAGSYDISMAAQGFKTVRLPGVTLNVGAKIGLNFSLEVGPVTEAVTIEGAAPVLQTETGEIAHIVSGTQIEELTLNGRNFTQVLALGTGVSSRQTGRQMGLGQEGNPLMVIHGGRISMNKFTYDGTLAMDTGGNRGLDIFPPMEAIAEIKVQKSNYSADTGGFGFGVVNLVTRSGGREFHGAVYEYFRNDKLDARNFFSTTRQVIRSNNFGFTLGGPIYFPGKYNTDKAKTFFFYSQSWARRVGQQLDSLTTAPLGVFTSTVPTATMRQGDFRNVATAIRDPDTGQAFPDNVIPANRLDPNALALMDRFYPLPNRSGTPNFVHNTAAFTAYREELVRFDQNFTSNATLSVRYAQDKWFQEQDIARPSPTTLPTFPKRYGKPGKNLSARLTTVINSNVVNQFTFGYSFNQLSNLPRGGFRDAGISIPEVFPSNEFDLIPNIAVGQGFTGMGVGQPVQTENPIFTWKDDLSTTRGRHTLKFGGELIRHDYKYFDFLNEQGSFSFDGSHTGHTIADFLLGRAFTYVENDKDPGVQLHAWDNEFYFQDDFKASANLALNLGVRWYLIRGGNGGAADKDNISVFVPALFNPNSVPTLLEDGQIIAGTGDRLNGIITPANKKGLHLPRHLKKNNNDVIGPRMGFAWSPGGGKTVIRGGYGINYFWGTDTNGFRKSNPPFVTSVNIQNPLLSNPTGGAELDFPANLNSVDINNKQPAVQSWSFSIQREILRDTMMEAAYVGTRGTHLPRGVQINQADPNLPGDANTRRPYLGYGIISYNENSAESRYHGLEISLLRRMTRGLTLQLSYTYSKALGHVEDNPLDARHKTLDWGLTADDRTHMFAYNYVWEMPFYKDRGGLGEALLAGWQLSGTVTFQSGLPSTVTQSGDISGFGGGTGAQRPNRIGDPHESRGASLDRWFNINAFERQTKVGGVGTEPVFGVRGPGINLFDVSLFKNIPLGEQPRLQLGLETFNIANHPSFDGLETNSSAATFGRILSARDPRVMQIRAKITF
jgi:Carboxypeptidase regulatory-like domain